MGGRGATAHWEGSGQGEGGVLDSDYLPSGGRENLRGRVSGAAGWGKVQEQELGQGAGAGADERGMAGETD